MSSINDITNPNLRYSNVSNWAGYQTNINSTNAKFSTVEIQNELSMGPYNTFAGQAALDSYILDNADPTVNAINNVAIGVNALTSLTTGSNNTAVGDGSLVAVTIGNNNVAIGSTTGDSIIDGSNNIVIGQGADVDASFSNQIVIGATGTVANQIVIGDPQVHTSGTLLSGHRLRLSAGVSGSVISPSLSGNIITLAGIASGINVIGLPAPSDSIKGVYYEFILTSSNTGGAWYLTSDTAGTIYGIVLNGNALTTDSATAKNTIVISGTATIGTRVYTVCNGSYWIFSAYPTTTATVTLLP